MVTFGSAGFSFRTHVNQPLQLGACILGERPAEVVRLVQPWPDQNL